jgi:hypothetical protein
VTLASSTGQDMFGVMVDGVAMDATGDAWAAVNGEQPYTGLGGRATRSSTPR